MLKINNKLLELQKFPSGEQQLNLSDEIIDSIKKSNKFEVSWAYRGDESILELLQVSYLYSKEFKEELKIQEAVLKILYFPYARMDRVEYITQSFSLSMLTKIINDLSSNFDEIQVLEPHSPKTLELLNKVKEIIVFDENKLLELGFNLDKDILAFPDKGAYTRYSTRFPKFKNRIIYGNKKRDFQTGRILDLEVVNNNVECYEDSIVWVIDDICSYGGTFIKFKENYNNKLDYKLVVTHLEDSVINGALFNHYKEVITTNSIWTKPKSLLSLLVKTIEVI